MRKGAGDDPAVLFPVENDMIGHRKLFRMKLSAADQKENDYIYKNQKKCDKIVQHTSIIV